MNVRNTAAAAVVLRWARDDLRALLSRDAPLSAVFFEQVALLAASRVRLEAHGPMSRSGARGQGRD